MEDKEPIFLITFANPNQDLLYLEMEKEAIDRIINEKNQEEKYKIVSCKSRNDVAFFLGNDLNRERLVFFYYSGHASSEFLITEEEISDMRGVASLLSRCRNLKLIILNGCSTEGQIKTLSDAFKNSGCLLPTIIATSAPIDDKKASEFAITFITQFFIYGRVIKTAFEIAIETIQTNPENRNLTLNRFLPEMLNKESQEEIWGLFPELDAEQTQTTLSNIISDFIPNDYIPNEPLFRTLIEEVLKPLSKEINDKFEADGGVLINTSSYKPLVYKKFPFPISKRLQRLDSSESNADTKNGSETVFYNKPDLYRMLEIYRTYKTIIDLLFSIVQAELYNLICQEKNCISEFQSKQIIDAYTNKIINNEVFTTSTGLHFWVSMLNPMKSQLFIAEIPNSLDSDFFRICAFFENIGNSKRQFSNKEAQGLTEYAEFKLCNLFKKIAFLSQYKLTSVENIFLNRRRHSTVKYDHQIFHLQGDEGILPRRMSEKMDIFLDNSSIIIYKENNNFQDSLFLNLSPFLIDDKLFEDKATMSNIIAFKAAKLSKPYKFDYRYLIYSYLEKEEKSIMIKQNLRGDAKIDSENKAFVEISNEWESYINLLKSI